MFQRYRKKGSGGLLAAALLFATGGSGLALAADADHDGVDDSTDRCPDTAQLPKIRPGSQYSAVYSEERRSGGPRSYPVDASGCEPDGDGDGVKDSADFCPDDTPETLAFGVAANGCPVQSDGDGTPDYRDRCPGSPIGTPTDPFGCPR